MGGAPAVVLPLVFGRRPRIAATNAVARGSACGRGHYETKEFPSGSLNSIGQAEPGRGPGPSQTKSYAGFDSTGSDRHVFEIESHWATGLEPGALGGERFRRPYRSDLVGPPRLELGSIFLETIFACNDYLLTWEHNWYQILTLFTS